MVGSTTDTDIGRQHLRPGPADDVCSDLYVDRVLLPRSVGFSAVAICSLAVLRHLTLRRRRRGVSSSSSSLAPLPLKASSASSASPPPSPRRLLPAALAGHVWLLYCLGACVIWWCVLFTLLQSGPGLGAFPTLSHSSLSSSSASSLGSGVAHAAAPSRMVFSFTTIADSIDKIQGTLDSALAQHGRPFDAIHVVVPRTYRNRTVAIPPWLVADAPAQLTRGTYRGQSFAAGPSSYHERVRVIVLDTDYGPASKLLGVLLVERDPETVIVYGDDDRGYTPHLTARVAYYTTRYPNDAIAVLGGWIAAEDPLYCGRSLEIGINRISFVGGAGGVAVRRKFYGALQENASPANEEDDPFRIARLSKGCFLGDDYYLSLLLSRRRVPRRLVYDSCWNIDSATSTYAHGGLSLAASEHPGGANVEHYQQCIRELGLEHDLSGDGEFGGVVMFVISHLWGLLHAALNAINGRGLVAC